MAWESHSERFSKFWAHSQRNNFSFFFKLIMSCDALNGLIEPFWKFSQVLSPFGAKQFFIFFQAKESAVVHKWLERAILNVLASFDPIRSEKLFHFLSSSEWAVMHQMAWESVLNVLASFEPIRSETIFHFCSSSKWAVMHQMAWESHSERCSKFWAHSERNNFSFFFKLRMSCGALNGFWEPFWTFKQVLNPFGAKQFLIFFQFQSCDAPNGLRERSERFSKIWADSERNNFSFLFKLKMSCDAPNGLREPFWTF